MSLVATLEVRRSTTLVGLSCIEPPKQGESRTYTADALVAGVLHPGNQVTFLDSEPSPGETGLSSVRCQGGQAGVSCGRERSLGCTS